MPEEQSSPSKSGIDRLVLYRLASMEDAVRQLSEQVGKLVVIEERQTQTVASVDRAFVEIKSLEARRQEDQKAVDGRLKALELAQPITNRTNVWAERLILTLAAAVITALLMQVGLK